METMTTEQIRAALEDRQLKAVAERIGLHFNTLYRIANGHTEPNKTTREKLTQYLKGV